MRPFAHAVTAFGAFVLFSATVAPQLASAAATVPPECWRTQCQRDPWPVEGCGQYGMTETERAPCAAGGHVYTCCRPADASGPPRRRSDCDRGTGRCRPTDETAAVAAGFGPFDGCRVLDDTPDALDGVRSPCADGYQHVCCADRTPEEDDDDGDDGDDDHDDGDDDHSEGVRTGRMTYFHLATTACGKTYTDRDMVGALGPDYFVKHKNPNEDPVCGKKVKIVDPHTSKSVVVRIVDKCGGCSKFDVNVSPAAFKKIKPLSASVTRVKWAFVS